LPFLTNSSSKPESSSDGMPPGPSQAPIGSGVTLLSNLAQPWWRRITFRLVLLVLDVCTVPPLTLGILAMRSARVAQEAEIRERNISVARSGVDKVQSYLDNIVDNMRLMIELGGLQDMDPIAAKAHLSYFLSFMEDVKEISLIDARGQERIKLAENTFMTSSDLTSQANSPKFQLPYTGKTYIGPVRTSEFSEPFVTVALPIRNLAEDTVVGVLAVEVNLKSLWDEVLSFKVGQSGYLYLVNGSGQLLAHPDFSLVLRRKDLTQRGAVRRFLTGEDDPPPGANLEYANYQEVQVVGVHARSQKLGWGVIVEQPTAEAFANVNRMKIETTLILINALIVTMVLAMLASRQLTRPLAELAQGARLLGRGDFSHTIPVRGDDELAEVTRAFNWMTENLRQSFHGLRTLLESTTRLAGVGRREDVLLLAVDEIPHVVGKVQSAVLLLETGWGEKGEVRARIWLANDGGSDGTMLLRPDTTHPVARALSSREVVTTQVEALGLPTLQGDADAPALVVPLLAGQQPRGALLVIRAGGRQPFGETEVTLCRTLANHLSIALQLREAHDQLVRSEKLRAVGEIAAGVAHNFNNVLGGILARAQLLQMTMDPAEIRRGLDIIERAALDGAGIVRRLQDSARLQTATPLSPLALNQVVRDALELTRPRWKDAAELRGKPIVVDTALSDLPTVMGDPGGLREVVTNIILNAVEAMPDGGRIRVQTSAWAGWVTLIFSDTGTGMSEDVRRRIFDPFFTTKGSGGTGLGMSVSYAIVKRHGGDILVESAIGQGTTIRLRLPAGRDSEAFASTSAALPSVSACCRILVVDDDNYVREILREVLASLGHRVEGVDSGQKALDLFTPDAFDLVITDLGMEVSGREVACAVKARSPNTPVILVTGWAAGLNMADLRKAGVDLLLGKPFQVNEVREVVAKALALQAGTWS
jgi:signal transduction histidine kinase